MTYDEMAPYERKAWDAYKDRLELSHSVNRKLEARIADLEAALEKIAAPSYVLGGCDTVEEEAAEMTSLSLHYQDIARKALGRGTPVARKT